MSRREKREQEEKEERERKNRAREARKKKNKSKSEYELIDDDELEIPFSNKKEAKHSQSSNKKKSSDNKSKKEDKKSKTKDKKEKKKKEKKKGNIFVRIIKGILKVILVLILILILLAGVFVGWLGFTYNWDFNKMVRGGAKQIALIATGQTQKDLDNLPPIYSLILGVSTDEGLTLTDTIIVAAYYPRTQQASMLSIPRDTFVGRSEATATSYDKLNAVYSAKGIDGVLTAVNKITGLNISNYVIVKNAGLREIVDAIGGVNFDVPIDMNYDDGKQNLHIHLKKGYQKLNGVQAEGLVRYRHDNMVNGVMKSYPSEYGNNDIGRMKTQRAFITETLKQTVQFKNITKVNELIDIVYRNVETNMTKDFLMKYTPAAVEFDTAAIETDYVPGTTPMLNQISFFKVNQKQLEPIVEKLFTFKQQAFDAGGTANLVFSPKQLKIQVLDGTGGSVQFAEAVARLEDKGYNVVDTATTTISSKTRAINRTNKNVACTDELIDCLGYGEDSVGKILSSYDYTVIVGEDMINYGTNFALSN